MAGSVSDNLDQIFQMQNNFIWQDQAQFSGFTYAFLASQLCLIFNRLSIKQC